MSTHASARAAKFPHFARAALVAGAAWCGWAEPAHADLQWEGLPPGVTIEEISDGVWRIETVHGATVVNFTEFNLFLNQEARFLLPGSNSRILNRVSQIDPSLINGLIKSNGIVYLVNPAGVVFDGNAVIDVAGFYAAAGDITDSDFLAGRDKFFLDGDVTVEAGAMLTSTGNLHLIGQRVANHGTITSDGGVITMLAGNKVVMSEIGGRLMVTVDGIQLTDRDAPFDGRNGNRRSPPAVENTGTIQSSGGRVILGAGDLCSLAIRNAGTITAAGGEVELLANGGLIWDDNGVINTNTGGGLDGSILIRAPRIDIDPGSRITGAGVFMDAIGSIRVLAPLSDIHDLTLRTESVIFIDEAIEISGDAVFTGKDVFLRGESIAAGGTQTFNGDVWLGTDNELTATDVFFNGMLNSKSNQIDPLCALVVNGNAEFNGTVGFGFPTRRLRSLTVNGASLIAGGVVGTADFQKYFGPVTLGADAILFSDDAGLIQFGDTLDGPFGLDVRTAGRTRFDGVVGGTAPLTFVLTDAPGDTRISANMTASTMTFGDAVKLGANAKLVGDEFVSFLKTVSGNGHDLVVSSPLTFFGDDATGFGLLRTNADGETIVDASRITGEKIDFRDQVTANQDVFIRGNKFVKFGDTLDGNVNLSVKSDELIELGGDVGGQTAFSTIELQSGGKGLLDDNVIVIDGRLIRATGDILLNPQGKSSPSLVASIAARGDVKIKSIEGSIDLGANEKMTALGDLALVARNGAVTTSDLNAVGRIRVDASEIFLRRRVPGQLFDFNGLVLNDDGMEVIAIEGISFSQAPTLIGAGNDPQYVTGPRAAVSLLLPALLLSDLRPEVFGLNPILDLSTLGNRFRDIASAYDDDEALEFNDTVKLDAVALRALEALGLALRPMTNEELVSGTSGRELYNDAPRGGLTRDATMVVTLNRLRRESLIQVVDGYSSLFLREVADPATGDMVKENRSDEIRDCLTRSWTAYLDEAHNTQPTAEGFRTDPEMTPEHGDCLVYLDGISEMFQNIWTMGATPRELRMCVDGVLDAVCPTEMNPEELERAVRVNALLGLSLPGSIVCPSSTRHPKGTPGRFVEGRPAGASA